MSRPTRFANRTQNQTKEELYEQVEMQDNQPRYMTTIRPEQVATNSPSVSQDPVSKKCAKKSLVGLGIAFLVCAVIISLVAVVMYSPLVQGSSGMRESAVQQDTSALLSRIQALERTVQAMQQLQERNSTTFESLQETQTSVQAQLTNHDAAISTLHNSVQSLSSIQTTLSQNVEVIRSINLYQGCIEETRTCTISTSSDPDYVGCATSYININPSDSTYFTSSVWCDLSNSIYFTSHSYRKSGTSIRCDCEVTLPSSSGHSSFPFSGTCTLTVTKCPRSITV